MQVQIKSNELVTYLAMGWRVCELAFNNEECWMTMEGSIKYKILTDLGLTEDDITTKKMIPGTCITKRMLCCWYARERYGLTQASTSHLLGVDPGTVANAHKRVSQFIKVGPINLKK